jgi:hypothetical protein
MIPGKGNWLSAHLVSNMRKNKMHFVFIPTLVIISN